MIALARGRMRPTKKMSRRVFIRFLICAPRRQVQAHAVRARVLSLRAVFRLSGHDLNTAANQSWQKSDELEGVHVVSCLLSGT